MIDPPVRPVAPVISTRGFAILVGKLSLLVSFSKISALIQLRLS